MTAILQYQLEAGDRAAQSILARSERDDLNECWQAVFAGVQPMEFVVAAARVEGRTGDLTSGGEASAAVRTEAGDHSSSDAQASADSVAVFVRDQQVAVIVRDTAISAALALQCAFAAARELTGSGSSLQQLTVNGRLLYRQASSVDPSTPALLFSC